MWFAPLRTAEPQLGRVHKFKIDHLQVVNVDFMRPLDKGANIPNHQSGGWSHEWQHDRY
jgi:hypothetical protein